MNNFSDTDLERVTEPDQTGDVRLITDLLTADPTIAMVMTMVGRHHSSRPVTCADVQDHRLSFLVSRQADWVEAIAESKALVHVTVSDDTHTTYLSLNGGAMVVTDPAEIVRLWSPAARAWFDGPDDPDLAVVHFDVSDGEYWDGPGGRVGRAVALLRAAFTGNPEAVGTQGQIEGDSTSSLDDDIARYGNTPDRRAG
jgi:general stress protein 26